jgi:hypothetical protein
MSANADKSREQIARKHHYVSEGYLAAFTNTGKSKGVLCAYDQSTGKFFTPKPKHVAFEPDYNRVTAPNVRPDAMETALGHFESSAIREVRRIITTGKLPPPDDKEFSWFYNLIGLFAVKCPAVRRASDAARKLALKQLMHLTVSSKELYERHLQSAQEDGFVKPDVDAPYERMKDFVEADEYTIEIPTDEHILTENDVFGQILPYLSQRYWSVMTAKTDAPDIITCDRPAPPLLGAERVVFPISPRRALYGTKELECPSEFEIDIERVARLNLMMAEQSMAQIYSRTKDVALFVDGRIKIVDISRVSVAK